MDMTGIETLLGPIGASPLDMEPISSGVTSTRLSADDDGNTLFLLPLFWTTRKWGFWSVVKGATAVAVCAVALLALRRCLRQKRRSVAAQQALTEPVSPAPLRSGKWMVVPAVSPPPPPIEERADVTEHDKQEELPLTEQPPIETIPHQAPASTLQVNTQTAGQASEEFNLSFAAEWNGEDEPSGDVPSHQPEISDEDSPRMVTSRATISVS